MSPYTHPVYCGLFDYLRLGQTTCTPTVKCHPVETSFRSWFLCVSTVDGLLRIVVSLVQAIQVIWRTSPCVASPARSSGAMHQPFTLTQMASTSDTPSKRGGEEEEEQEELVCLGDVRGMKGTGVMRRQTVQ